MAETARATRQGANSPEYSVSELSSAIKKTLESTYGYVRLRGEISGFRGAAASGHCYFALKDEKAKIEAVIWRGVVPGLRIKPAEGLEVIATGRITSYPGSSKYQIVIDALEPAGVGALMALLEDRKKRLASEGLFDPERKRKLPFLPRVVGIVTSPTGAVIRDMLHGFEERFPVRVLLWPVRVQGETCAPEVAAGIRGFNAMRPGGPIPRPDVLIVARGGGSLEDLWGFNEEEVVRAAAESKIPLISAVGHETDWTLIDLAADARAPTPTKAAEWAVPKYADLIEQLGKFGLRLFTAVQRVLDGNRVHLRAAVRGLPRRQALLDLPRQRFDAVERRLGRALSANTRAHAMRLAKCAGKLNPGLVDMRVARKRARLEQLAQDATAALQRRLGPPRRRLERAAGGLRPQGLAVRLARARDRLDTAARRLSTCTASQLEARRRHLDASAKLLVSLSYHGVLARGFALLRDADGNSIRSVAQAPVGSRVNVEVNDGRFSAEVLESEAGREDRPAARTPSRPAARAAAETRKGRDKTESSGSGGQGSLF